MSKKQSQAEWVKEQLRLHGKITRNQCLSRFPAITRLGAIICHLKASGYHFTPESVDGDFVYTLTGAPTKPHYEQRQVNGEWKAVLIT